MRKVINLNSPRTIQDAIKQLERLRTKRIPELTQRALDKCMELGIEVARGRLGNLEDLGNVGRFIGFKKTFEKKINGYSGILIMYDERVILQAWLGYDFGGGKKTVYTAEVSPALMYEFGAGVKANTDFLYIFNNQIVAGRGTFPSENTRPQGNKNHAKDSDSWRWTDLQGYGHKSSGIEPTMPMYNAWVEMDKQIKTIGREVFRSL